MVLNRKIVSKFTVLLLFTAVSVFALSRFLVSEQSPVSPCSAISTFASARELPGNSGGSEGCLKTETKGLLPASVTTVRKDKSGRNLRDRTESAEPANFNKLLLTEITFSPEKISASKNFLIWISDSIPIRAGPCRG